MNILLVNHLLDSVSGGGTAERTFQLARFLARAGAACTVLVLDIGVTPERRAALAGTRLIALPCWNRRFFLPRVRSGDIEAWVGEADVVLLSGHWTLLNAMLFRACVRLRKPYLFCPAGALKTFGRSYWLKRGYDLAVGEAILQGASACVAITADEGSEFLSRGIDPARVAVIPNGIDPDEYSLADPETSIAAFRTRISLGALPYVLFLGRQNAIKGPDLLLDAFRRIADQYPDLQLVFAGPDGGMQAELMAEAISAGLAGRIRFAGYVGGDEKAAALCGAELLAIPSRREAMSIVVLEAGACGCPVLFTNTCGLDSVAQKGAGTMTAVGAEALAQGLKRLLAEPDLRGEQVARMASLVDEDYRWSRQAERLLALAGAVVDAKRS